MSYLPFFTETMREAYQTVYVDAFAGTGEVYLGSHRKTRRRALIQLPAPLIDGSARRALKVIPPFDEYLFIDKRKHRYQCLRQLGRDFTSLADRINVKCGDANESLAEFCAEVEWKEHRAVLFLDPSGLQVEWTTLEAVARTRVIDVWYLFPLGVAVNRLLRRDGQIDTAESLRLDRVFGDHAWYRAFYKICTRRSLFGQDIKTVKIASFKTISVYFLRRLKTVFPFVAERPLWLYNRTGNPMFLLYFVTADPKGQKRLATAQKILSIPSIAHDFSLRLPKLLSL